MHCDYFMDIGPRVSFIEGRLCEVTEVADQGLGNEISIPHLVVFEGRGDALDDYLGEQAVIVAFIGCDVG